MEANLTELQQVVEALQVEIGLLRVNVTSSITGTTTMEDQLTSFSTNMDTLWLLLGSTLVVCECSKVAMVCSPVSRGASL